MQISILIYMVLLLWWVRRLPVSRVPSTFRTLPYRPCSSPVGWWSLSIFRWGPWDSLKVTRLAYTNRKRGSWNFSTGLQSMYSSHYACTSLSLTGRTGGNSSASVQELGSWWEHFSREVVYSVRKYWQRLACEPSGYRGTLCFLSVFLPSAPLW